ASNPPPIGAPRSVARPVAAAARATPTPALPRTRGRGQGRSAAGRRAARARTACRRPPARALPLAGPCPSPPAPPRGRAPPPARPRTRGRGQGRSAAGRRVSGACTACRLPPARALPVAGPCSSPTAQPRGTAPSPARGENWSVNALRSAMVPRVRRAWEGRPGMASGRSGRAPSPRAGEGWGGGPPSPQDPSAAPGAAPTTQKPASRRVFAAPARAGDPRWPRCREAVRSLDLAFLVDHVLADDGIVLLDLHLPGGVLLVLVRGVEVAGAGRRNQADLVALGCHGVLLLRPSRHACAARRGRRRCQIGRAHV